MSDAFPFVILLLGMTIFFVLITFHIDAAKNEILDAIEKLKDEKPFPADKAIALLKESREALAAAMRVIHQANRVHALMDELRGTIVQHGIGVRLQQFISENDK